MIKMTEQWRDIAGYEGYYQVSSLGNIKSIPRYITTNLGYVSFIPGQQIKTFINTVGYVQVHLSKNNRSRVFYVHRLVANAFMENPEGYTDVNHKDHNKVNNAVWNLEWVTHSANMLDMRQHYGIIKHPYICAECGKSKNYAGHLCLDCEKKRRRQNIPSRDELKAALLVRNFEKLGKMFGITGKGFSKWCKIRNLPYKAQEIKRMTDAEILAL